MTCLQYTSLTLKTFKSFQMKKKKEKKKKRFPVITFVQTHTLLFLNGFYSKKLKCFSNILSMRFERIFKSPLLIFMKLFSKEFFYTTECTFKK